MAVLVVVAIVVGLAAPAVGQFIESNRLSSATNTLLADLSLARSEAVKRQLGQVVVCTSSSGTACSGTAVPWSAGWIVFWDKNGSNSYTAADDVLLRVQGPLAASVDTETKPDDVVLLAYTRVGTLATAIEHLRVSNSEINQTRTICMNAVGRASLPEDNKCS